MSKLSDILQRRKNSAKMNAGKVDSPVDLPNGLRIRLEKKPTKFKVYLSRKGKVGPSETEIETILKHWPSLDGIEAEDFTTVTVFYITEK